jgi:antiviral helicase SLH1
MDRLLIPIRPHASNPESNGIDWEEKTDNPKLVQRRRALAMQASITLQQSQMVIFNETTEELRSQDIDRIASQYYIQQTSIQTFNKTMNPRATEADIFKMIARSGEFDNIQSRDNEIKELSKMKADESVAPCVVEGLDISSWTDNTTPPYLMTNNCQ